jgi:hypothetical protein
MKKSSSAEGFLMVVVRTVVHLLQSEEGHGGFGVNTNAAMVFAAAVEAGPPPGFWFPPAPGGL